MDSRFLMQVFQCKADERCIRNVCIPTGAAMCCPETQVYDEENDQCIPTPICECDFVTQECVDEVCVDLGLFSQIRYFIGCRS